MTGGENNTTQGFVIVLEGCDDRQGKNWARVYLSKIYGSKEIKICEPNYSQIVKKVESLLPTCWRTVLLIRKCTVDQERSQMIQNIQSIFPNLEIVGMTYL